MTLDIQEKQRSLPKKEISDFRTKMLSWYDSHGRELPWRSKNGERPDPYHIWLSEIMLQQTTVTAVMPYYRDFLERWPSVQSLAQAPQEDVMSAWAGLGYYARARNLHACAKIVSDDLNGVFPQEQQALKKLPGIGDYTSAALRTIAFNKSATVVDGNIERIMARYFAIEEPLPAAKPRLKDCAALFFEGFDERPGDLAQSLMDLGAGMCIAKTPRCALCPIQEGCQAYRKGNAAELPLRTKRTKPKPQKYGEVYWVLNDLRDKILLHKRPQKGLLGGMLALPTTDWLEPSKGQGKKTGLNITHSFTHFDLELVLKTKAPESFDLSNPEYYWANISTVTISDFPSLFQKALKSFGLN